MAEPEQNRIGFEKKEKKKEAETRRGEERGQNFNSKPGKTVQGRADSQCGETYT